MNSVPRNAVGSFDVKLLPWALAGMGVLTGLASFWGATVIRGASIAIAGVGYPLAILVTLRWLDAQIWEAVRSQALAICIASIVAILSAGILGTSALAILGNGAFATVVLGGLVGGVGAAVFGLGWLKVVRIERRWRLVELLALAGAIAGAAVGTGLAFVSPAGDRTEHWTMLLTYALWQSAVAFALARELVAARLAR